jgi:hypothetical protein
MSNGTNGAGDGSVKLSFGKKVETTDKKVSGEVVASDQKTEHPEAGVFPTDQPLASVNVHLDARIGKPNYSSVGVGVSLTMPCLPGKVDDTFEKVKSWVEDRMAELTKEVGNG